MIRRDPLKWRPSSMEMTCLRHLDYDENWEKLLGRPRPDEIDEQRWAPFFRIFWINMLQFGAVFLGVYSLVAYSQGGIIEVKEDLAGIAIASLVSAMLFSAYVMYLYRRSWNRRARLIQAEQDAE